VTVKENTVKIQPEINKELNSFANTKKFLKENKEDQSLWKGASIVVGFIALIGLLALFMAKMSRKGVFKKTKKDNALNIISTLSINPKRQVMILQVRDKEIVISNTESGINFITDIGNHTSYKETVIEKKPFQIENYIKSIPSGISKIEEEVISTKKANHTTDKKSDLLLKALKRMEKEPAPEKPSSTEEKQELTDMNGKFPKYFSNIFENESKKEIKKKDDQDSVENVTNLIREKLRSMKPLN
jgi:flagellar biogenesis protein FliO